MTASDVRKLIVPMIDFSLKTPVEAFADTLPPKLKGAVLNHEVLVGMNREMVLKAVGQPDQKVREMDGQTPFEEWIYGQPPHEVQFVRFNGNRVIRLEIADVGQPPVIRDKDETDGYFAGQFVHQVRLGDAPPAAPNQEHAPTAAPTLRQPGEQLPERRRQRSSDEAGAVSRRREAQADSSASRYHSVAAGGRVGDARSSELQRRFC